VLEVEGCPRTSLHHQYFRSVRLNTPERRVRVSVRFHQAVASTMVKPGGVKQEGVEHAD